MNPKDLIGAKKAPLAVVPPSLVPFVAPAMAVGANKYGPFNWRAQPVQAMTYIEAAFRHLFAWVDGQEVAEDTGVHHIAHAIAGLAILADALSANNWIDNRPTAGPTADILRAQDKSLPTGEALRAAVGPAILSTEEFAEQFRKEVVAQYEASRATECPGCGIGYGNHLIYCPRFHDGA